jgi:phosphoserine phosphatase
MTKKICLADWDGTLRAGYTVLDWLIHLSDLNITDKEYVQKFNGLLHSYRKGLIRYDALVSDAGSLYAAAISGKKTELITRAAAGFVRKDQKNLFPFCIPLLNYLRHKEIEVVVISGAPFEILAAYSEIMPISKIYGLRVKIDGDGYYSNQMKENYGVISSKLKAARSFSNNGHEIVLALGDSVSDKPLFASSSIGIYVLKKSEPVNASMWKGMNLLFSYPEKVYSELMQALDRQAVLHR